MKSYKMQGQSNYFSGIWIVKDAALWYAVHRANRSAEVRGITTQKKRGIWDLSKQQWTPRHGEQGQVLRQLRHSPNVKKGERIMRINWFKDENHLVYINGATQLAELERRRRPTSCGSTPRRRALPSRAPSAPAGGCSYPT